MRAVAQKKPSENHKRQRNITNRHSVKLPAFSSSFLSNNNIIIQLKPICPCDGGCPRCAPVIQPKITIGQPNDKYEQEADRVAEQVMKMPESVCSKCMEEKEETLQTKSLANTITPLVQCDPLEEEEDLQLQTIQRREVEKGKKEELQMKSNEGDSNFQNADFTAQLTFSARSGSSLNNPTRSFMESCFGADFSNVRVHTGGEAERMNRCIHARAFTHGRDVYFNQGQYQPEAKEGMKLLAHELTHVIQQGAAEMQQNVGSPIRERTNPKNSSQGVQRPLTAQLQKRHPMHELIQCAEFGTYISTLGDQQFLNAAERYYRSWRHPNIKRVSNMDQILVDLSRSRGNIDTFRIVSHATAGNMDLGTTANFSPASFSSSSAIMDSPHAFRFSLAQSRLVDDATFNTIFGLLRGDRRTLPFLNAIGAGSTAPRSESVLGILLRAIVETVYVNTVTLTDGSRPNFHNSAVLQDFNSRRLSTYSNVIVSNAPRAQRSNVRTAITQLRTLLPTVLQDNNYRFTPLTQQEADNLGNPLLDPRSTSSRLSADIATSITEGADGPYMRHLQSARSKISANTHIEIRGCNVGRDTTYLDNVRRYFRNGQQVPSISAPDLFQFFFLLNYETFTQHPQQEQRISDLWSDDSFRRRFESYYRLRQGDYILVVETDRLDRIKRRYNISLDIQTLYQLNPQLSSGTNVQRGQPIWLKVRRIPAGNNRNLDDVCRQHLGNPNLWPRIWSYNPQIRNASALLPIDQIYLAPQALVNQVGIASPARTLQDFRAYLRGGSAYVGLEMRTNPEGRDEDFPVAYMEHRRRVYAISSWLHNQGFDPRNRTSQQLQRIYRQFAAQMRNTYIQFLSLSYPRFPDPILPDDPRYNGHIIRRP